MYDLRKAYNSITTDDILSKVSEYEIFKRYCYNFDKIDESFLSDLYRDTNPGCRIYQNNSNRLIYKDFGTGESYDCFGYIQAKYNCTFKEALNIVYNDFKLGYIQTDINPRLIVDKPLEVLKKPNKSFIEIKSQPFTLVDYNYWNQYYIPLDLLQEYDVFSCKYVYLHKEDRTHIFEYKNDNPIYAYRFTNEGKYSYKIYFPLHSDKKRKWLFSGGTSKDIEGYDQLPLHGDTLILTKSLKDCIVLNILGYSAISLQGETNKLSIELFEKLKNRFNNIICLYDNDVEGLKGASRLFNNFNIKNFIIPKMTNTKDISDFIKVFGINKAKKLIDNKIWKMKRYGKIY